jgi:hypothetical protein
MPVVDLEETVKVWRGSLCPRVELAALYARNPTAHKWKTTYRSIVLRELVCWRVTDLLAQVDALKRQAHILGAVILLRSAIETLAVLIYLNQKTEAIFAERSSFFSFCDTTASLMLGSKNETTSRVAINIMTILNHCEKKYPGLTDIYGRLSESAHPNYDGVCSGYSSIDETNYVTEFSNRWEEKYRDLLPIGIDLCVTMFQSEYNIIWPDKFSKLEQWLADNDQWLEANKSGSK